MSHTAPSLPVPPSTLVPSSAALAADHFGFAVGMISLCFFLLLEVGRNVLIDASQIKAIA